MSDMRAGIAAPAIDDGEAFTYADLFCAKLMIDRRSQRWLADNTGIGRSRIQRLLQSDRAQRKPIRLAEQGLILPALGLTPLVATFTVELMQQNPSADLVDQLQIALMMSALNDGLVVEVAQTISGIEGIEHSDIRPEFGTTIRAAILRALDLNLTDLVRRRCFRLDGLLT